MNKLKSFLNVLKKHHFWVLWVVVILVGLWAWSSGTSTVGTEFDASVQEIDKQLGALNQVTSVQPHPNDKIIPEFEAQRDALRMELVALWNRLYQRQRQEVLFWPPKLGQEFVDAVDGKKFGAPISSKYRDWYLNYVKTRFGELASIVEARGLDADDESTGRPNLGARQFRPPMGEGVGPGAQTDPEDDDWIVEWDESNQQDLQQKLVWEEVPSSLKIWVTQEDLWVYEALLNIIAKTNEGVTPEFRPKAPVAVINALEVGKEAADASAADQRGIAPADSAGARGGDEKVDPGAPMAAPPTTMMEGDPGAPGGLTIDPEAENKELMNHRYLDSDGVPLPGGQEAEVGEYKRIPVLLDLQMHQTAIPALIANCDNAALPVEITQVRINPNDATSGAVEAVAPKAAKGTRGRGRTTMPVEGDFRAAAPPRPGRTPRPGRGDDRMTATEASDDHDHVILHGIIYIFNPPDAKKLGLKPDELAALNGEVVEQPGPADADETDAPLDDDGAPADADADEAAAVEGDSEGPPAGKSPPAVEPGPTDEGAEDAEN